MVAFPNARTAFKAFGACGIFGWRSRAAAGVRRLIAARRLGRVRNGPQAQAAYAHLYTSAASRSKPTDARAVHSSEKRVIAEMIAPDDGRWNHILQATAHDVYHLPGFGSLYARSAGEVERARYVKGAHGELLIPLILRYLPDLGTLAGWRDASSPYGYPGPIISGEFSPLEVQSLRASVVEELWRNRVAACFVRGHPVLSSADPLL